MTMLSEQPHSRTSAAPVYRMPEERVVSVEHPCIVKHFDNGFKSLGGEPQLRHVLEHKVGDSKVDATSKTNASVEPVAGVSLRPNDPLAKKMASTGIRTRNILIKVTVPKWTGRKRKRGSSAPFMTPSPPEPHNPSIKAPQLLRHLQDNEDAYSIAPIGMISDTHRFRAQPDFQMRSDDLPIMHDLKDHLLAPSYSSLQTFHVDLTPGPVKTNAFPMAPSFTPTEQPYKYEYRQASDIVYKYDEYGNEISENSQKHTRRQMESIPADATEVPQSRPHDLRSQRANAENFSMCVERMEHLLEKRPLVTIRALLNTLREFNRSVVNEASQWVGYSFSSGPWRDTLIKYGVDPRSDPKYRFYQSLMFQLEGRAMPGPQKDHIAKQSHKSESRNSHIFDGITVYSDGKIWQVCDITDPILYNLLRTNNIPKECDVYQWGWYYPGTLAKVRIIMKDKLKYLLAGETPPEGDYNTLLAAPDEITDDLTSVAQFSAKEYGDHLNSLGHQFRVLVRGYKQARLSKGWKKAPDATPTPDAGEQGGPVVEEDGGNKNQDVDMEDDLENLVRGEYEEESERDDADSGSHEPAERSLREHSA